ncbi:hypothetical protein K7X08_019284 [Anisodus acutangulus]|uniref:Uncharacterized protein n=1 Tax=Anisodus acutangulus TaxID=402998 RepID=A0A9Q1RQH0_9SOLA|nr:hypothetical protein K7X08_019284 [Anisodus acutangulus]
MVVIVIIFLTRMIGCVICNAFLCLTSIWQTVWKDDEYDRVVEEIIIDAPNLKSFEYYGGLTSFPGIKASHGLEFVKLHLRPKVLNARWYICSRTILDSFSHSKHLILICQSEQDIIFPDELTETLLLAINSMENLELQIDSSTASSQKILDGFI